MEIQQNKHILVAPLNWGLGHATRCIPIINELIYFDFEPIIASDGMALELLKKEFPQLPCFELPSYHITYPKKGKRLKTKLILDAPHFLKTIKKEKEAIKKIVKNQQIDGIISDNRFGVRHKQVPSVFLTHQLRVLSGSTTWLSTKFHQQIISKFDECWVPDHSGTENLSGDLGHDENLKIPVNYLGPLSRFNNEKRSKKHDLLVILSGPEPQRTYLEELLLVELKNYKGDILFVKGTVENEQKIYIDDNITICNFMTSDALEKAIKESELILSRSGYTTIMDLAKLEKNAFFIPTPGQFEQEYLAKKLKDDGIAPSCTQDEFKVAMLNYVKNYSGFKSIENNVDFEQLFSLF